MTTSILQSSLYSRLILSSRIRKFPRSKDYECSETRLNGGVRTLQGLREGLVSGSNLTLNTAGRKECRTSLRPRLRSCSSNLQDFVDCIDGRYAACEPESGVELSTTENQWSQVASDVRWDSESTRWRQRREFLLTLAMCGVMFLGGNARAQETESVDSPNLELYIDEKEGFKLLRPALWNKVEKAGATVLFEDPAKRGNTIGVVVNPVRIASLKDFGTPGVVADKLIAAERKKPSTNDAQLVQVQERQAHGDTPLYVLEYTLDSSRGQKKILSAVTVASRKLYILNISYADSPATPAPPALAEAFKQVLNSFELLL